MPVHTQVEGPIGILTLDRPERAHAYDRALLDALLEGVTRLARDTTVLVIQSSGTGAFCSGADLDTMKGAGWRDALELRSQLVFTTLARLPVVTIAAVQGAAVAGGFELALACDLRVAGPAARFWLPETGLGLLPSAGGTTRLARLTSPSITKAVVLGGLVVDAPMASAWGLVHRLADDPGAAAVGWAREIAARDPAAQARAKERIDADESDASLLAERVVEAGLYLRRR